MDDGDIIHQGGIVVMSSEARTDIQEKETGRVEAFSDGVFAIALTLLVLDIKVPHLEQVELTSLGTELVHSLPNVFAFAASFFFVLVMWINHHRLFTVIRRADNNLLLLNGLLLFGVTLVPFPTAVVAEYISTRDAVTSVLIYNGWFFVVAIFFNMLWWYAASKYRLFDDLPNKDLATHISRQYMFGPFSYLLGILLAFIHPYLGIALNVGMAIFFAIPNKAVQEMIDAKS
jgi:uncharacterized membrane protein